MFSRRSSERSSTVSSAWRDRPVDITSQNEALMIPRHSWSGSCFRNAWRPNNMKLLARPSAEFRRQPGQFGLAHPVHSAQTVGEKLVHVTAVFIEVEELKGAESIDELPISHLFLVQASACRPEKYIRPRLRLQETCSASHEEAVPHLLPGECLAAVHPFEDVQPGSFWNFRIDNVEYEVAVLDAVLQFGRQVGESLAMQFPAIRQVQPQFIPHEPAECRQTLQAIDDHHSTLVVFSHVEHGEGNAHDDGFDQFALLVLRPDEITLEVGIHHIGALIDPPGDVVNRAVLMADQEIVDGIVAPGATVRIQQAFGLFAADGLTGLLGAHGFVAPYLLRCHCAHGTSARRTGSHGVDPGLTP